MTDHIRSLTPGEKFIVKMALTNYLGHRDQQQLTHVLQAIVAKLEGETEESVAVISLAAQRTVKQVEQIESILGIVDHMGVMASIIIPEIA